MSRFLSELLGAKEPEFRFKVRELERANGEPSADIRLSSSILQRAQSKLRELGLDANDTTPEELYMALQERLKADDGRLRTQMRLEPDSPSPITLGSVQRFLNSLPLPKDCFALKPSVAKRLLKQTPPKKTMKALGYRSLDSMLKHEPPAQLYTAAMLYESSRWRQNFIDQYSDLSTANFESRKITTYYPQSVRWQELAEAFADKYGCVSVTSLELGAVVILPVSRQIPALTITSTLILLESFNDIRSSSSYFKLQQVKPDFGDVIKRVASGETYGIGQISGQSLPWRMVHYYYSTGKDKVLPNVLDPHVQLDDLQLVQSEKTLAKSAPALEFWQDSATTAYVHDGATVSVNILDVALSVSQSLPFSRRALNYVRDRVWHELLLRYLNPYTLEQLLQSLSGNLAEPEVEPMLIDDLADDLPASNELARVESTQR